MKERKKFDTSSWSLYVDKVHFYAYWEKAFSPEECKIIIDVAKKKGLLNAQTLGNISNYRNSKLCWLYSQDGLQWAFKRLTDIVLNLNERFFQFDLFGLNEGLQFTNYKAPSGEYRKHIDRAANFPVRKLSLSVQLTNPKKYKGGDLILHDSENKTMKKEQGTLILFPSYILHEVTPVTKGERNSLVTWVTGKQFK